MARRNADPWIWGDAVDLLEQAERLQRRFFRLAAAAERATWEAPVDVYFAADQVLVEVALPGVPEDRIDLVLARGELIVRGERRLNRRLAGAAIHRLEIPHGCFERRLPLPAGNWDVVARELSNGCLHLLLARR